jgi:hypothetical protein
MIMSGLSTESGKLREAKQNPAAMFNKPQDVLSANDLSTDEKRAILEQWKQDSMQLQQAADENMTGGEPSQIEDVVEALKALDPH